MSAAEPTPQSPRLGVNIDHIATLRELRGTPYPDILWAARAVAAGGAASLTIHLREDRRHIQDADVKLLREQSPLPLNLEMSCDPEIVSIALKIRPEWVCLVPERREEVTTEGGLDLKKNRLKILKTIARLKKERIKTSLFVEPALQAVRSGQALGADALEFHTGRYAKASQSKMAKKAEKELERLQEAAGFAEQLGMGVHAGHGIDYVNVRDLARLRSIKHHLLFQEFNIGHSIVCKATEVGLETAVRQMKVLITAP